MEADQVNTDTARERIQITFLVKIIMLKPGMDVVAGAG